MSEAVTVLSTLFSEGKIILPSTKTEVQIKKVTLRTMKPVIDLISAAISEVKNAVDQTFSLDPSSVDLILKLISNHYDEVIDIVVAHTSLEKDQLLDMDTDDSVLVIQALIALNKDFFTKKVLPNLQLIDAVES